jgi:hypothetical protein
LPDKYLLQQKLHELFNKEIRENWVAFVKRQVY